MGLLWRVMARGSRAGWIAFLGALVCMAGMRASAAQKAQSKEGEAYYIKYCAACHGESGKGDGVASSAMQPPPTDLTQIAKKHDGKFNDIEVMDFINGKNMPKAHGRGEMPVWGEIFHQPSSSHVVGRGGVQSKLMAITQYLRSIQEK